MIIQNYNGSSGNTHTFSLPVKEVVLYLIGHAEQLLRFLRERTLKSKAKHYFFWPLSLHILRRALGHLFSAWEVSSEAEPETFADGS